ncbi:MAG TPA: GNAT family N-acetyltransferase [Aldersonia sp.]
MTTVDYRPLTADDEPAVRDLYREMANEDTHFRYIGRPPSDYDAIARALTTNDSRHGALGAFVDGDLVGAANFLVLEMKTAEVAIVVEHDAQGRGIGTALLDELADIARRCGLRRFVAEIVETNTRMLELLVDSDFPIAADRSAGIVRIALEL